MKSLLHTFLFLLILSGCQSPSGNYKITSEGVFSKKYTITQFSISQFILDHDNLEDIRPIDHTELMRYCCELLKETNGEKNVFFNSDNSQYRWSLCRLDTTLITNDSLNSLSLKDKLEYINQKDSLITFNLNDDFRLPFIIMPGYVYQIFGLPKLEGSYYFCLNSENKLLIQFADKGPW